MLGRNILRLMQRNVQPKFCVPKRNWAQVGMVISTPPRVPVSYGEKVLHILFMYAVSLAPVAYFLTQLKVWRREYIQDQSSNSMMKETKQSLAELRSYFATHNVVREYIAHTSKVHSVGWSCDGRRLASGSFDKSVAIFTLERNRLVQDFIFRGHTGSVDQLCWHSSHPDLLSTASGDKSVRIWDVRTHKCAATISTKGENINIAWSPSGATIAVGNKEDLVSFIDARTYKVAVEEQFNFEVNEISWNNNSDLFYLTNGLGCVHILTYPGLELQTVLKAHPGTCICIEHDPTGRYFATGSADALVSLWDVEELACLRVFSRLEWPVRTLSFSHDGRLLASASEDHIIDIGDTETGENVAEIPVSAATFTVAWHPARALLAFACEDREPPERKRDAGNLKLWGLPAA